MLERTFDKLFGVKPQRADHFPEIRTAVMHTGQSYEWHDGEKFPGGLGPVPILTIDYWTLRKRSADLFERNIYARGLVRRLVTAIVGPGLTVEATPEPMLVGMDEEQTDAWSEQVELMFELWGSLPSLCHVPGLHTFAQLQQEIYREAIVAGDVLVIMTQDPVTKLPKLRTVSGEAVQTPIAAEIQPGRRIVHGVELDKNGKHLAYYIRNSEDNLVFKYDRVSAFDADGRPIAWLVYGSDSRMDSVRGQPLLTIALQSLKEIDRYRDSVQRKALLTSLLAFVVTKDAQTVGSGAMKNLGGGFTRQQASRLPISELGSPRNLNASQLMPGMSVDELAAGEDIKSFGAQGTDEKFAEFEGAIVSAVAWSMELPPEIAGQKFSSNYSASQAANNEFKLVIDVKRDGFGDQFIKRCYREFLLSAVLMGQIRAPGLVSSIGNPAQWFVHASWLSCEMSGAVKPSVDPLKMAKAAESLIAQGLTTRARACRELTGQKYSKVVRKLARENLQLVEANKAVQELMNPKPPAPEGGPPDGEEPEEKETEETED